MSEDKLLYYIEKSESLLSFLPSNESGDFCRKALSDCRKLYESRDAEFMWNIYERCLDSMDGHDFSDYLGEEDELFRAVCDVCCNAVCYMVAQIIDETDGAGMTEILDAFQEIDDDDWEREFSEDFSAGYEEAISIAKERGLTVTERSDQG